MSLVDDMFTRASLALNVRDDEIARLKVRCAELLDACNQKQALLDNVAEDQRGMMALVEDARRERDEYDRQRKLYHADMMAVREQRDRAISVRTDALAACFAAITRSSALTKALRDLINYTTAVELLVYPADEALIDHDVMARAKAVAARGPNPSCPECHGTGQEGTGQPSDEGGEAFRACEGCNGSELEPSCPGCGHPREWHERENWGGECIADGCACVHARET